MANKLSISFVFPLGWTTSPSMLNISPGLFHSLTLWAISIGRHSWPPGCLKTSCYIIVFDCMNIIF